jgi:hypothetical protein
LGTQRIAYFVGSVDGGEGALEAAHLLGAVVGLAEVSPQQVVVAIFHGSRSVVFRGELVCIVTKKCAFT